MVWRVSSHIFQFLRCRKLAVNRDLLCISYIRRAGIWRVEDLYILWCVYESVSISIPVKSYVHDQHVHLLCHH